ncbi:MAG: hypothetical protein OXE79_02955 [Acidimicrobiaceae bacterium]|nr:hypothetical protein [Acidimicrobiaceae bacterium]MCY4176101.1 hypothetical protein [Acidimicrobiaceae bacterium]MCY4279804.1 hypothetical protein [Acidimicrobiaceae bacterium]MCY4295081.1 hypothetical protein [Acidimicrobiaceae bacterium]
MPRLPALAPGSWVARQAKRRGLLGSSRVWFAVFVAGGVVRLARRAMKPDKPETLLSERIGPGEGISIRNVDR